MVVSWEQIDMLSLNSVSATCLTPGVAAAVQSREGSVSSQMSLPLLPPSFTLRHNEVADSTLPEATVIKVSSHQLKRTLRALVSIPVVHFAHLQLLGVVLCKVLSIHGRITLQLR